MILVFVKCLAHHYNIFVQKSVPNTLIVLLYRRRGSISRVISVTKKTHNKHLSVVIPIALHLLCVFDDSLRFAIVATEEYDNNHYYDNHYWYSYTHSDTNSKNCCWTPALHSHRFTNKYCCWILLSIHSATTSNGCRALITVITNCRVR